MFFLPILSFPHPPIQYPCFHTLDVHIQFFDAEIEPRKKPVECIEIIALRHETFEPNALYLLFAVEFKKHLDFVQIQIDEGLFSSFNFSIRKCLRAALSASERICGGMSRCSASIIITFSQR